MGVFPAASRAHVPQPWGVLMTDPVSYFFFFFSRMAHSLNRNSILSSFTSFYFL